MKSEKNEARIAIKVSDARKEEIEKFADKCGFTVSGLIKVALYEYMKNNQ